MTTPEEDALWRAVVATRDEIGAADPAAAALDDEFIAAVLAAEAQNPENREAASVALTAALDGLLGRLGPIPQDEDDEDEGDEMDDAAGRRMPEEGEG